MKTNIIDILNGADCRLTLRKLKGENEKCPLAEISLDLDHRLRILWLTVS